MPNPIRPGAGNRANPANNGSDTNNNTDTSNNGDAPRSKKLRVFVPLMRAPVFTVVAGVPNLDEWFV